MRRIEYTVRKERFERSQKELLPNNSQRNSLIAWKLRAISLFRRAMFYGYPAAHSFVYLTLIAYRVAFVSGVTPYWSPLMHLLRTKYSRLTPFHEQLVSQRHRQSRAVVALAFSGLRSLVPLLFFFLRFLDWWYSPAAQERFQQQQQHSVGEEEDADGESIPAPPYVAGPSNDQCHLCQRQPCKDPAVLCETGYLFCFGCISNYLLQHRKCPVSGTPIKSAATAEMNSIRRLFDGDA